MALWTPAEITTALWLDAADSDTITLVSGNVSQWDDKSGNAWNATQTSAGARPAYASGELTLDGSKYMTLAASSLLSASGAMNYSMAMVFKRDGSDVNGFDNVSFVVAVGVDGDNAQSSRLTQVTWNDSVGFRWNGKHGTTGPAHTRNDNWNVHSGVARIGTGNQDYYLNGGNIQTVDLSAASGVSSNMIARIGSNTWAVSQPNLAMVGKISEVIISKSIWSDADRQKIEGYLAWKWGLEANLPVGHPYENAAPDDGIVPAASLTLTTLAPTIDPVPVTIPAASLTLTALAPTTAPVVANIPAAALTLTAQAPTLSLAADIPAAGLTLTTQAPGWALAYAVPAAALTLTTQAPTTSPWVVNIPAARLTLTAKVPVLTLSPPNNQVMRSVFRAYLVTPGYDDLELPISSFQARLRLTTANYLAIVVPNPLPYIDAITERSAGRVVIKTGFALADGTEALEELTSGVFNTFRYDLGAFSGSATIVAYDYRTPRASLTRIIRGISLRSVSDGVRRIRCEPDMYLQPGDIADLGMGETLTVEQISYAVGARLATMEISEAEPI